MWRVWRVEGLKNNLYFYPKIKPKTDFFQDQENFKVKIYLVYNLPNLPHYPPPNIININKYNYIYFTT